MVETLFFNFRSGSSGREGGLRPLVLLNASRKQPKLNEKCANMATDKLCLLVRRLLPHPPSINCIVACWNLQCASRCFDDRVPTRL